MNIGKRLKKLLISQLKYSIVLCVFHYSEMITAEIRKLDDFQRELNNHKCILAAVSKYNLHSFLFVTLWG